MNKKWNFMGNIELSFLLSFMFRAFNSFSKIRIISICEPVSEGDDTYQPLISAIAGHIDEHASGTHMEPIPLFYINTVSNAPYFCVFHAHIPDPLNGGSPRVTDIDLVNLSGVDIEFAPGHIVDINIQRVLGSIADDPYTEGPVVDLSRNVIYDLNDDDTNNDGLGHSSQNN